MGKWIFAAIPVFAMGCTGGTAQAPAPQAATPAPSLSAATPTAAPKLWRPTTAPAGAPEGSDWIAIDATRVRGRSHATRRGLPASC